MPTQHTLSASTETVHWGYFDAKLKPQITVDSGDTVTLHLPPNSCRAPPR